MARNIEIGYQDFETVRQRNNFYIDKTNFIKEWWERGDNVTLITRPRRFGKTLNMSMLEKFFSVEYADRGNLFEGLNIWQEESYRKLQGTYPVISLTFANVKENNYRAALQRINQILVELYNDHRFLLEENSLLPEEKEYFCSISEDMPEVRASMAVHRMAKFLSRYYSRKVIILLDEYDTPMQEAYVGGYWEELTSFTRSMFNASFKTNPYLERAIMTGITRISKESIFSDLNNLKVVTTTSGEYADCFGFTEEEVFGALREYGLADRKKEVKDWYDGFTFGDREDMYNPWSIINYLDTSRLGTYWANSSSNSMISKLLREGSKSVKQDFEQLMCKKAIEMEIDEQIVYDQLSSKRSAVWSLLLASGYLKVLRREFEAKSGRWNYQLTLTNREVYLMFEDLVHGWFSEQEDNYNDFIRALLQNNVKAMNTYINQIALTVFSCFDTGKNPSAQEPERFYHGFVLGLLVELSDRYLLTSNRESGFGRYDVVLEPRNKKDDAYILEFKVQDAEEEKELSDTVAAALKQIREKEYETTLVEREIPKEHIRKYGFAFQGKKVLIGTEQQKL